MFRPVSLKTRLALGAALPGLAALLTAAILVLGMGRVSDALSLSLAAERRVERYAALSSQVSRYLVIATEALQSGLPPETRVERLAPAAEAVARSFAGLRRDLEQAVAQSAGLDARSRRATQSLSLARMEALFATVQGAMGEAAERERLRAHLDTFSSSIDPVLSEAVGDELRARAEVLGGIETLRRRLTTGALGIALVTVVLFAVYVLALLRPQLRRLDRLREAARRVGQEDFAVALPEGERDEIGQLFSETNRMARALSERRAGVEADRARLAEIVAERTAELREANARLARIDSDRRRFFADISHELRTPLTVILMEAQLGRAGAPEPEQGFATIETRALRLSRRIDDLLRVARSESGQLALEAGPVDLAGIAAEALDEVASELRAAGLHCPPPEGTGAIVTADRNWLRQILAGLLRNAARHAAGGGAVALRLDGGAVSVLDNGPGIPAEAAVFERFAQGEGPARGEGFGIGLALTRWVIEAQGGTVELHSPVPGDEALGPAPGTKVTLSLPRAEA